MPIVRTGSKFAMPDRLYRYRPLGDEEDWSYLEQILLDSTMYGAPRAILKRLDPDDCLVAVNTLCTLDEFKQSHWGQKATQQHPEWSESELDSYLRQYHKNLMKPDFDPGVVIQRSVNQSGVICFSTDGDIPTQWQTYASERRGVCLEFDPLKDLDFFGKVKPVDYVDVLEPANVFIDTFDVQVRKRLYTKLAQYESEAELARRIPATPRPAPARQQSARPLDGSPPRGCPTETGSPSAIGSPDCCRSRRPLL